ncbi:hypothetical protein CEXT_620131 [Caerostris extrusa]|uniref:Uncharacterized protein n=1 Tax=Caerostris extrusa TaxID=172846 RepID=A0AAV4V058_CAEEX|nr:hypothetical protein CEXT_620131 [Caerostris extrusa]
MTGDRGGQAADASRLSIAVKIILSEKRRMSEFRYDGIPSCRNVIFDCKGISCVKTNRSNMSSMSDNFVTHQITPHISFVSVPDMFPNNVRQSDQIKETCWWKSLLKVPAAPRRHAIAAFLLENGHDCLIGHLFRFNIISSPIIYYAAETLWTHHILKKALKYLGIYMIDIGRQERNFKISGLGDLC